MNARIFPEVGKFIGVGALNTLLGLLVIYAAKWFLQFGDAAANALGYAVGLSISFMLNGSWTFAYRGPRLPAFGRFLLAMALAYCANLMTVLSAIHLLGVNGYVAQALGIPPFTLTSFLASKYMVFRR